MCAHFNIGDNVKHKKGNHMQKQHKYIQCITWFLLYHYSVRGQNCKRRGAFLPKKTNPVL